ncbi:MAG: hypothetical protein KAG14_01045 [Mycoplasmataceae bacterium]|nr:hypothetical protein [Mycoplasmataceae bacterium]
MVSPIAGKISEHVRRGKRIYIVKVADIKKIFNTIEEAHEFSKKMAHKILDVSQMLSISIWYERYDKRATFLRYENFSGIDGKDSIRETEETAYEFVSDQPKIFKKNIKYRMLNERQYCFSDIARLSTNSVKGWFVPKILLSLFILLTSIPLIFYSLHIVYLSKISNGINEEGEIIITILTVLFIFPMFIISFSIAYTPLKVKVLLQKNEGDIDAIPWRKMSILRRRYSWISIIMSVATIPLISSYIYELYNINVFNYASTNQEVMTLVVLSIMFLVFILFSLLSTVRSFTLRNNWWKENSNKYFTKNEQIKFKLWMKDGSNPTVYRTVNSNYFIINSQQNIDRILARKKIYEEIEKTMTTEDITVTKEKAIRNLNNALYKIKKDEEFKNNL